MPTVELPIPVRDLQPGDKFRDEWTLTHKGNHCDTLCKFVLRLADGSYAERVWTNPDHIITITRDVPEPAAEWTQEGGLVRDEKGRAAFAIWIYRDRDISQATDIARHLIALRNLAARRGWTTEEIEAMGKEDEVDDYTEWKRTPEGQRACLIASCMAVASDPDNATSRAELYFRIGQTVKPAPQ